MTERVTAAAAMRRAEQVAAAQGAHEDICAERYGRINEKLEEVKDVQGDLAAGQTKAAEKQEKDIVKIYDLMWKVAFGVIGTLVASVVSLIGVVFLLVTKGLE